MARTKTATKRQEGNLHDQEYETFLASLRFTVAANLAKGPAFTTDVDPDALWKTYLKAFKPAERKYHDCSACRHFHQALRPPRPARRDGQGNAARLAARGARRVRRRVRGLPPLRPQGRRHGHLPLVARPLGTPTTGVWRHMAIIPPDSTIYKATPLKTAGQAMAEKREDFANVERALEEFSPALVARAVEDLDTEDVYRKEKVLGRGERRPSSTRPATTPASRTSGRTLPGSPSRRPRPASAIRGRP